jgi:hypothetical protein
MSKFGLHEENQDGSLFLYHSAKVSNCPRVPRSSMAMDMESEASLDLEVTLVRSNRVKGQTMESFPLGEDHRAVDMEGNGYEVNVGKENTDLAQNDDTGNKSAQGEVAHFGEVNTEVNTTVNAKCNG